MRRNVVVERTRLTLRRRDLLERRWLELHRVHAQIKGTTTSINDNDALSLRILCLIRYSRREQVPYTKMKTGFTLCQKSHAATSIGSARYEPSQLDCTSNLLLLRTLPAVWMGQDELDVVFDRQPYVSGVRFLDVGFGAPKQVFDKVREDSDDGFASWKWWDVVVLDVCGGKMFGPEVKFPPSAMYM